MKKISKLNLKKETGNDKRSYKPDIAVSRRFTSARVNEIYDVIQPILNQYGRSIECSNTSTSHSSPDHWLSRMGLIFDCCSIHLLIDIDRSKSTLFEFEYSNISTYFDKKDIFVTLLDCRPIYSHKPTRIIIYESGNRASTPTLYSNKLKKKLFSSEYVGTDIFVNYSTGMEDRFKHNLERALKRASYVAKKRTQKLVELETKNRSTRSSFHSYRYEYKDYLAFLDAKDFLQLSQSLMQRMQDKIPFYKVKTEIVKTYRANCLKRGVTNRYDFSAWNVSSQYAISEYNTVLSELVESLSSLLMSPRSMTMHYQYLLNFLAFQALEPDDVLHDEYSLTYEFYEQKKILDSNLLYRIYLRIHAFKQSITKRT